MKSRRQFLRTSAMALSAASLLPEGLLAGGRKNNAPADGIGIGVIGLKGQGWNDLNAFLKIPGVKCTAICDIDDSIIAGRLGDLEKQMAPKPAVYKDYRRLLADPAVNAVIIGTPDHWHCLQLLDACAAGKDVYCEKPVATTIHEGELMVRAVERSDRIVQVGQWQRSQRHFKEAIEFVRSGKLGVVADVKVWDYSGAAPFLSPEPDGPVPAGVDYAMWLGPATERPFNKNRFHYTFRWFWEYAGGLVTDWGVHLIDMALMGMNTTTPPLSVVSLGGKYVFPGDARETPDVQTVAYNYGSYQLTWQHNIGTGGGLYNRGHGIAFIGGNGTLLLNREGWEVVPNKTRMEAVPFQPSSDHGLDLHAANFIDVVRSRKKVELNCPIDAAARVAFHCHLGNIALRTGNKVVWDAVKGEPLDPVAARLVKPVYHNGWKLPG